jgi:hypothetical protein
MDRKEDTAVRLFLNRVLRDDRIGYVLGGHDHDIGFVEPTGKRYALRAS